MVNPFLIGIPIVSSYIDPGTGSLIIQILVAGLIGGLFMLKAYWKKVKKFILRIVRKNGR